jgi:hypothetical protein
MSEKNRAGHQPVKFHWLYTLQARQYGRTSRGVDDNSRSKGQLTAAFDVPVWGVIAECTDVGFQQSRPAPFCFDGEHAVEALPVKPPAGIVCVEKKFVAEQIWVAPSAYCAKRRVVTIACERLAQSEMIEKRLDLRRHGFADAKRLVPSRIGKYHTQTRCQVA